MTDSSAVDNAASGDAGGTQVSDAGSAGSSTAGGAGSMFDAVQAALKPDQGEQSLSSQTPENDAQQESAAAADKAGEKSEDSLSEEEQRDLKPKTKNRISQLLTDRTALRAENAELKTRAENYDRLNSFIASKGLTEQDVANGFEIMGLMKQNPRTALEKLAPLVDELRRLTGEELPDDLKEKVRLGYLDEPTARETARLRADKSNLERRQQEDSERSAREREMREHQTALQACQSAGTEWETAKRGSDPDWNLKQDRVHELLELELRRRHAAGQSLPSRDDTVKLLDSIHAAVTKEIKRFAPRPQKVDPPVQGTASSRSVSAPKTYLEAVQHGIRAAAG